MSIFRAHYRHGGVINGQYTYDCKGKRWIINKYDRWPGDTGRTREMHDITHWFIEIRG